MKTIKILQVLNKCFLIKTSLIHQKIQMKSAMFGKQLIKTDTKSRKSALYILSKTVN